jgi:predicted dienelactone hydrolase
MARFFLAAILALFAVPADAAVGVMQIAGTEGGGKVTVFYPSSSEGQVVKQGPFSFRVARGGAPQRGNGRLVVISHGSGGVPAVHFDLTRALVENGFVVAFPTHRGDNYNEPGTPGPESWKRRPLEVSNAIDAVARDARFAPLLALDKVGMYGFSAGGHAALSLAGGRWSPALFTRHCQAHIAEDAAWETHTDSRIAAIVAACPYAADFDMTSSTSCRESRRRCYPRACTTTPRRTTTACASTPSRRS